MNEAVLLKSEKFCTERRCLKNPLIALNEKEAFPKPLLV
jgi:hypothetical protein